MTTELVLLFALLQQDKGMVKISRIAEPPGPVHVHVPCGGKETEFTFETSLGEEVHFNPCETARAMIRERATNTHERVAIVEKRIFIVQFYVLGGVPSFDTLVNGPDNQEHWHAEITILEVVNGEKVKLAGPFEGVWTERGCFEDDPEAIVKRWLETEKEAK